MATMERNDQSDLNKRGFDGQFGRVASNSSIIQHNIWKKKNAE